MDYQLSSAYNPKNNIWEITVTGEIDIFNSNDFKEKISELISERPCGLYINCGSLRYIDSTAMGALVSLLKKVKEYGGVMKLKNLNPNLSKLFRITNLDKVFSTEDEPDGQ